MKKILVVALIVLFIAIAYAQVSEYYQTLQAKKTIVVDSLRVGGALSATSGTGTFIWKVVSEGDTNLLVITAGDTFVIDSVRSK